jgi:hypothetical protein
MLKVSTTWKFFKPEGNRSMITYWGGKAGRAEKIIGVKKVEVAPIKVGVAV